MLPSLLKAARHVVASRLPRGGLAVDATAGRGRDTLFLARWVGQAGKVIAYDVQPRAIEETRTRLQAARLEQRVELRLRGHETLIDLDKTIHAAMFNLGYLPGSDKTRITQATTTIAALTAVCDRLHPSGVLTVVAYPGHPGGREEFEAVEGWFASQSRQGIQVAVYRFLTASGTSPALFVLENGVRPRRPAARR